MREKKYQLCTESADFRGLSQKYNIDPVVCKVMINRGVKEEDFSAFLNPSLSNLHSPFLFGDMEDATNLILKNIEEGNKIIVVSDYDVDGVCSGFIMKNSIENIGGIVSIIIPDRIMDGYGINKRHVDIANNENCKLIITTDNGIAALDVIKYAKDLGIKVIITDHHEVPRSVDKNGNITYQIPPSDFIINHKVLGCGYPFKDMCGAGVALKVSMALNEKVKIKREKEKTSLRVISDEKMDEYLEFAALATVCDIVSLTNENRDIVTIGMKKMKNTKNIGLKELIKATGINVSNLSSYHFGFILGPCINSSGRLKTADMALELFETEDLNKAAEIAGRLKELNDERKSMTLKYTKEAIDKLKDDDRKILLIHLPDCHESVAGLVASKIKEEFYKPAIVFAGPIDENGNIKGSARSIEKYNIYEGLSGQKELMVKFGGHSMAAGLTIKHKDLVKLSLRLNENCDLNNEDLIEIVKIDCKMPPEYISEKLISDLNYLEPFGKDNNKPTFGYTGVRVKKIQILGANSNVLRFNLLLNSGKIMNAVMFTDAYAKLEKMKEKYGNDNLESLLCGRDSNVLINFTYYPTVNEYMGNRSIQLNITDLIL